MDDARYLVSPDRVMYPFPSIIITNGYGKYKVDVAIKASDPAKGVTMGDAARVINELSQKQKDAILHNSFDGDWPDHHFLEGAMRVSCGVYTPYYGS
ncbi:unnamed protein product [Vitrella brassicaformis CCMP3155]|uniref:Uncharacterized protein n=1 Tax=Vitrella brassicaformis (strain CCMP3155) TaxID=1169540 RepID=A0A0G4EUZ9_VITBC|nr:unnamed protein product [Vitrella brassicaformis CCMP3155]|mmetsp:Transcript_26269/g.65282  ORF Transcript_26269/g.65282 Transcript_26269/m.65282 type:complete len:97 (+) Transcript_26269:316-606(+)|eukprot:CEM01862.1 unnamed protein product [Vitrella brassicaformis CCMP3155]